MQAHFHPPAGLTGVLPFHKVHPDYISLLHQRRNNLLGKIDSFVVFCGVPGIPGEENSWFINPKTVFQEPALLFLTGINQAGLILVLNPHGEERAVLFIPEKNEKNEFWTGNQLGFSPDSADFGQGDLMLIRQFTGIKAVRPVKTFDKYFLTLVAASPLPHGFVFYHEYPNTVRTGKPFARLKSDHNWRFKKKLQELLQRKSNRKDFQLRSVAPLHLSLRATLNPRLLPQFKKAVSLTRSGFLETLAHWGQFSSEKQLAAHLRYSLVKHNYTGLSFPPIVASGANAAVLHYIKNDCRLKKTGMVLLDFGIRYGEINTDVSRTLPCSGRFNPLQSLLYRIILDTQAFNQKNVRPGTTIQQLNRAAWQYLEKRLASDFFAVGGKADRPYENQPHGISHLLGIQVHEGDPMRLYQDVPLKAGWVISNEPGIYGCFKITIGGHRFHERLGIRIEDDLLVTAKGCINLTASIPKSLSVMEKLTGKV